MTRHPRSIAVAAGLVLLLSAEPVVGGGLLVPGSGSQAQPRAGAFVAKADDPTALFHNPAGIAKQDGTAVHIGANFLNFSLSFQRTGAYEATPDGLEFEGQPYPEVKDRSKPSVGIAGFQSLPSLAVSSDLGTSGRFRFAAGTFVPNAYPAREFEPGYSFEDPEVGPPPQRYDVMRQEVIAAYPSIAIAARVTDELDLGLRLSYGFAEIQADTYVWGIRNYEEATGSDAVFSIDVNDPILHGGINLFGTSLPTPLFGFGALYRPLTNLELGFSYRSATVIRASGTGSAVAGGELGLPGMPETIEPENEFARCEKGGTIGALKACLNLDLPQTATVGARWVFRDAMGDEIGDVELDLQWEDWSNASDYEVIVDGKSGLTGLPLNPSEIRHGFRDSLSVRFGGAYGFPVAPNNLLIARGGVAYDTAAAPKSWTRVDVDGLARFTVGAGVGWQNESMRVDLGAGMVIEPTRTVNGGCNPTVDAPGCEGTGSDTPVKDRDAPDPIQPLASAANQVQSPFNDGRYEQQYIQLSLGLTRWF